MNDKVTKTLKDHSVYVCKEQNWDKSKAGPKLFKEFKRIYRSMDVEERKSLVLHIDHLNSLQSSK